MIERIHTTFNEVQQNLREGSVKGTLIHLLDLRRPTLEVLAVWQAHDEAREKTLASIKEQNPQFSEQFEEEIRDLATNIHERRIEAGKIPYFRSSDYYELERRTAFEILLGLSPLLIEKYGDAFEDFIRLHDDNLFEEFEKRNLSVSGKLIPEPWKPYW